MIRHLPEVTVIGAGIGGLAVATALARCGVPVRVLEQAPAVTEVGAGLQITPNGAAVLRGLGLGTAVARAGIAAQGIRLRQGATGRRLTSLDLAGLGAGHDYLFVHRADLVAVLLDGARAAGVVVETGAEVTALAATPEGTRLSLADGSARLAPVLIGADGVKSRVREMLNGRSVPFFTRQVAWRALIPAAGASEPAVAEIFVGPGRHLVSYPLRGGSVRNIVAVEERPDWAAESWSQTDDPEALRAAFDGFGGPVRGWLAAARQVHLWGLFRHPVAPVWHQVGPDGGTVALIGDAAHPTLPFLAQGGNMALEDAWTLAAALLAPERAAALADWQAARRPRVSRIVEGANANARAYHLRGPVRALAHGALRLAGLAAPGLMLARFAWIYDYDATRAAPLPLPV